MINYNKFSNQLKELLIDFGLKISKTLSKPHIKFVSEMIFGIASSRSIHLSNISRTLKESISIKETVDRLSYNLNNLNDKVIWDNYRNSINTKLDKDTLFNLDNSDIIKPHGTKFEDLCRVHDGSSSDSKTEKGYWVSEIVALRKRSNNPISVYSNIWSSSSSGFKSANNKTFDALNSIYDSFGNLGTVVMDRGYDDSKMFNYFLDKKWNFIIRGNKNRIINYQTKKYKMEEFCDKYKGKITVKIHLQIKQ